MVGCETSEKHDNDCKNTKEYSSGYEVGTENKITKNKLSGAVSGNGSLWFSDGASYLRAANNGYGDIHDKDWKVDCFNDGFSDGFNSK